MVDFASIGHVAIKVKDMASSLEFYTVRLGFPEILRLNYSDGSLFLIYLRITDTQYLELFPNGLGDRAPDRDAVAVNHFCLIVDDIEHTAGQLAAAGVALTRPIRTGPDDNRQAWIEDPDGNRIEIMQLAPSAMQFEAVRRVRAGSPPISKTTDVPAPFVSGS
ncbi:MAG: VOC family protein [Hyphomicrobiales bacterium]